MVGTSPASGRSTRRRFSIAGSRAHRSSRYSPAALPAAFSSAAGLAPVATNSFATARAISSRKFLRCRLVWATAPRVDLLLGQRHDVGGADCVTIGQNVPGRSPRAGSSARWDRGRSHRRYAARSCVATWMPRSARHRESAGCRHCSCTTSSGRPGHSASKSWPKSTLDGTPYSESFDPNWTKRQLAVIGAQDRKRAGQAAEPAQLGVVLERDHVGARPVRARASTGRHRRRDSRHAPSVRDG